MASDYSESDRMTASKNEIRALMDEWAAAFRAKDLERIMACYAPDVTAFDMLPPLRYKTADEYRKVWDMCLPMMTGPITLEMRDLVIEAGTETGFSHCLSHYVGKGDGDKDIDMWMRSTVCYRKIDGRWLVVHEHVSVPIDMESNKGMFDLKP